MTTLDPQVAALLKDSDALIPAIVQDSTSKEVLMLAYMNAQSLELTRTTGKATYWSRSRDELWVKGATSGHYQEVQSIALDCDGDALVLQVIQTGAACHTGQQTCFHTQIELRS